MFGERDRPGIDTVITLAAIIVYALRPLIPQPLLLAIGIGLILTAVLPFRRSNSSLDAMVRVLFGGLIIFTGLPKDWYIWPAYFAVPIVIALVLGKTGGFAHQMTASARNGRLGSIEIKAIVAIAVVAAIALTGWLFVFQPDLHHQRAMLPDWPIAGLVIAGLVFSVGNAILEEWIWRGALFRWFARFLSPIATIVAQALSFGAAHYSGFPSGVVGSGLAMTYAVLLGLLRLRSGGLLAPIIAHVAADAVIVTLLVAT